MTSLSSCEGDVGHTEHTAYGFLDLGSDIGCVGRVGKGGLGLF